MSLVSTAGIKDTPTRLAIQKLADKLDQDKAPTFAGLTLTGKVTVGSFGSPIDVTSTRQYGFELHYSGNNYNVTGLRSRASLITTADSSTRTACGALLQAANSDGISVNVLNGALIEAMGKSTASAATISTMRGALINTEWSAKDTITDLRVLHVRTHTRDNATEGYFSNSGYGIYLENEAVGGNGQALSAGLYFKGTNLSAGNKAFTYGIDFSGGTFATAELRFSNGETIDNLTDGRLYITGDLALSGTLIGYLKYDSFAGDVYTLDTAGITLTAGTLTADTITDGTAILTGGNLTVTDVYTAATGGIHIQDAFAGDYLTLAVAEGSLTDNEILSFNVGDVSRILTFSGDPTLGDWFNQSVKTNANVEFNRIRIPSDIDDISAAYAFGAWANGVVNFGLFSYNSASAGTNPAFALKRARGTEASPANVIDNDRLGGFNFFGYNSGFQASAAISCYVDGTPGTYVPTEIVFETSDAEVSRRAALTITPAAGVIVSGTLEVGDGTNELQVSSTGVVTLAGTARVLKSRWFPFNALKAPGTKPAEFKEWGISGVWEFSDATDDTIVFNLQIPTDMDITVAPSFLIGWSTNTAVTAETAVWQLEYLYTALGEDTTAAAQETLTVNSNAIAQADGLIVAEITGMDLPEATDACLHCRLKRLGADPADDLTDTAELHGVCIKYTSNKLGTALA